MWPHGKAIWPEERYLTSVPHTRATAPGKAGRRTCWQFSRKGKIALRFGQPESTRCCSDWKVTERKEEVQRATLWEIHVYSIHLH